MQHVMTASPANQHLGYRTLITTRDTLIGSNSLRQLLAAYVTSFSACRPFPQPTAITGKDDKPPEEPQLSASSGTLSSLYALFLSPFLSPGELIL